MSREESPLYNELRVAIRYITVNVPWDANGRANRVAGDFAKWQLKRDFDRLQDVIHHPADFDAEESKSVWMMCDFNIRDPVANVEIVPLQFWKVTYMQEEATFKERQINGKNITLRYPWGGREFEWKYRLDRENPEPLSESSAA